MKFTLIFFLSLLLSCGGGKVSSGDNNLILKIGENKVYLNEFLFYLKNNYEFAQEDKDSEVLSNILDDFVESRILIYSLREINLHPSSAEIAEYLKFTEQEKKVSLYDINQKRMYALHTSFIIGEEKLKNYLLNQVSTIDEKEVRNYYEKHIEDYFRERTYCFVRFYSSHEDLLIEARNWMVKKLKDIDFIKMRYQDIKVSEEQCFEESELPEVFLKVLVNAKKKKVTEIVETTLGKVKAYNMFLLTEVKEQKKITLDEEYKNIEKNLKENKLESLIKKFKINLLKKYRVVVYPDNLLVMDYMGKFPVEEK